MSSLTLDLNFEITDLVAELISLQEPSRSLDQVIDVMIGGNSFREKISLFSVRSNKWLYTETPYYTRDIKSVVCLAAKHGIVILVEKLNAESYMATAMNHSDGKKTTAVASLDTCAAIIAVVSLKYGVCDEGR